MTDPIRESVARAIDPYAWPTQPGEPMRECGEPAREQARRRAGVAIAAHLSALEAQGLVVVPRFDREAFMAWFDSIPTEPTPALREMYRKYREAVVDEGLPAASNKETGR